MNAHFGNRAVKALWIGASTDIAERIGRALAEVAVSYDQRTPNLALQPGSGPAAEADVIFIEIGSHEDAERFEKLAVMRRPEQRLVAITTVADAPLLRQLIRLGLSDWLEADATEDDILAACEAPKALNLNSGPRNVLIFTPVLGGMGATTLAIETAIHLCQNGREPTCIVDLDLYAGECADFLNIQAKLAIDSLAKSTDAIDEHLLESVLAEHPTGIRLLAAQTNMSANQVINPATVVQLLNLVSGVFENVIIDMPRAWQPWTDDVILGADGIFLVADSSVPALRAARRQIEEFMKRYSGKVKPHVIVNKYDRTWFSTAMREKDLEASLGKAFAGTVLDETKLAREAIDRGVPISTLKKNATLVKDLHAIMNKYTR
jgi:pilus assembly protein CpaE